MNKVNKTKILISGWYGHGNIGDEAILQAMIDSIEENIPNTDIKVLSYNPIYTSELQGKVSCYQIPIGIRKIIFEALRNKKMKKSLEAIKDCDVFIMGGGGFLSDWQKEVPFGWLKQMILAKKYNKKTMLYAIGAGPFNTKIGKWIIKNIINRYVDIITVRDELSKQWLIKCGVYENKIIVTGDPVINIKEILNNKLSIEEIFKNNNYLKKDKINIGLVFNSYFNKCPKRNKKLTDNFIEYINWLNQYQNVNIVPLIFENFVDAEYNQMLFEKSGVNRKIEKIPFNYVGALRMIKELDFVVSLRLHGNIICANQGIPFIPIIYHHKTDQFCKGINWNYKLEIGDGINWTDKDLDVEKLKDLTVFFMKNFQEITEELKLNKIAYQQREKQNIDVLKSLLKG